MLEKNKENGRNWFSTMYCVYCFSQFSMREKNALTQFCSKYFCICTNIKVEFVPEAIRYFAECIYKCLLIWLDVRPWFDQCNSKWSNMSIFSTKYVCWQELSIREKALVRKCQQHLRKMILPNHYRSHLKVGQKENKMNKRNNHRMLSTVFLCIYLRNIILHMLYINVSISWSLNFHAWLKQILESNMI